MRNLTARVSYFVIFSCVMFLVFQPIVTAEVTEKREENIELSSDGEISLSNIAGDITIETWNKDEVNMSVVKTAKTESDLQNVEIKIRKTDNNLEIKTKYKKEKNANVSVSFDLVIPEKASIEIVTISGDVKTINIGGELDIETISGNINIDTALKGIECTTISGTITVNDVSGDSEISTISGDLSIQRLRGSLEATSVSGEIKLIDITEAEKVKSETVSGDLAYTGDAHPNGTYKLNSHSGDIIMKLPAGASFEISGSSFSGDISSDFDLDISNKAMSHKLSGSVGKGETDIEVNTFSGDIQIKKF